MADTNQKISRTALLAMVVGGMVGAGIFALPSRFGAVTGPIADRWGYAALFTVVAAIWLVQRQWSPRAVRETAALANG